MSLLRKKQHSAQEAERLAEKYLNNYGDGMLRFAYSYVKNYPDAEEILQDAVIRVIEAAPEFENDKHEKAYLYQTVANLSRNRLDYNKRRETDELYDELISEEREDLSFVWEAVRQLPENFREVIHLFYYEGYSTEDIAEILNRKSATVRSDLSRAREKLRVILKEDFDFE